MCVVNDESYTLPYRVMNNKDTLNSIPQTSTYVVEPVVQTSTRVNAQAVMPAGIPG